MVTAYMKERRGLRPAYTSWSSSLWNHTNTLKYTLIPEGWYSRSWKKRCFFLAECILFCTWQKMIWSELGKASYSNSSLPVEERKENERKEKKRKNSKCMNKNYDIWSSV
jgi:hypothetical protein